jgi:RHS repeat-associated protein
MKKLVYMFLLVSSGLLAQTSTENYVKSTIYKVKTLNATTKVVNGNTVTLAEDDKNESITYFDGLGRPKQSVAVKAGGQKQDIITPIVYDAFGRQVKSYLPFSREYVNEVSSLKYESSLIPDENGNIIPLNDQYLTKYPEDFAGVSLPDVNAYSEKIFENSPLNRVLEQAAPGEGWKKGNGHTLKFGYATNYDEDFVRIFSVNTINTNGLYQPTLEDTGQAYVSGELYKTITKDENWKSSGRKDKTTEEYKNKQGQIILKRSFNKEQWHDTYYVYDDFGNLSYVLPPKVSTSKYIAQQEWTGKSFNTDASSIFTSDTEDSEIQFHFLSNGFLHIIIHAHGEDIELPGNDLNLDFINPSLPNMGPFLLEDNESGIIFGLAEISSGYLQIDDSGVLGDGYVQFEIVVDLSDYQNVFTPPTIDQTQLDKLGYQYKYDHRNRLVEKKIPGKGWEYIVYDNLDRPVLTQDANLREHNTWLFTKYDVFGRVIYTGLYTSSSETAESLREEFINKGTASDNYEEKVTSGTGFEGTYYTNNDFPTANTEVLTLNYYDNYSFNRAGAATSVTAFEKSSTPLLKGLSTGSRIKVLETDNWITNVNYFDQKARPLYIYSKNEYLETIDIVESKLDFVGKTLETKITHKKTGKEDIVTIEVYTYDHQDRLLSQKQCVGDNTLSSCGGVIPTDLSFSTLMTLTGNEKHTASVSITLENGFSIYPTAGQSVEFNIQENSSDSFAELIVKNHYDALGQLDHKKVGNTETAPLQTVNYKYNIRGWLKTINQDTINDNDLFNFTLKYNNPTSGTPLFNGNISQTSWNTLNTNSSTKTYTYSYDALNRITGATGAITPNYDVSGITYDKNGNIQTLTREGHLDNTTTPAFGTMDNLVYDYGATNGNRLIKVRDTGDAPIGVKGQFQDGNPSGNDYTYDANGNMTRDLNKGITGPSNTAGILYNHLNLPRVVNIEGESITYFYDATGIKLKKIISNGNTTDYAGNYIYKDNDLQFFNHAEGYVKKDNGIFNNVYQYKDHLGNIRLSYSDANNNGSIAQNEIIEESNYYPFGLKHKGYNNVTSSNGNSTAQKRGYQDQMLDDELGLNWNTFKYRNYDPSLARFHNIDPLAEDYYYNSTYAFSENKVIQYSELEGLEATTAQFYSKANQAYQGINQFLTGAKETVVASVNSKAKTPTATQKDVKQNQISLDAGKDKMSQGLNMTGLPIAPSAKQVLKAEGYLGDAMVVLSPLAGPFAPAVAGAGTAISTSAAVGEAISDLSEGNNKKVVTAAVVDTGVKIVEKALKIDKATTAVKVIKNVRTIFYKKVVIPKIIEKIENKN